MDIHAPIRITMHAVCKDRDTGELTAVQFTSGSALPDNLLHVYIEPEKAEAKIKELRAKV